MNLPALAPMDLQLRRDSFGRLLLTTGAGETHVGVIAVRAFPIAAPAEGLSLVSKDGHELAWIEKLSDLPDQVRALVEEELSRREFVPVISQLQSVSTFATPSIWTVTTDRGDTRFVLRGEEDIRRISQGRLLITDNHGIQYQIPDILALDSHSRKLLDRFL